MSLTLPRLLAKLALDRSLTLTVVKSLSCCDTTVLFTIVPKQRARSLE